MEVKSACILNPGTAPWLVFPNENREKSITFFNVSDGSCEVRNKKEMHRTNRRTSYYGWLVLKDQSGNFCLLNSVSRQKVQLARSLNLGDSIPCILLSSTPTDPGCEVVFLCFRNHSFSRCHPSGGKWIRRKCNVEEGNRGDSISCAIYCNGKLYAYTLRGNLGIVDVDGDPVITCVVAGGPSMPPAVQVSSKYLVESLGEMFLVHRGPASRMKRDCIYFTKPDDTSLYVYHLDRGTISVDLPCPNAPAPWHKSFWVMPLIGDGSESKQANQGRMKEWMDTLDISGAEKKEIAEHVSWSDLPRDILQEIALRLFQDHHLLFPKAVGYSCIEATTLVFLFDPFTKEKIQLPDFEFGNFRSYVSSSSSPTSPGCIIFAVAYYYCKAMSFYIYHRGDISWTEQSINNEDDPVKVCFSNPVFYGGFFCILGHDGRLGVYHPEESTWTILTKPKPLRICCREMDAECKWKNYLVESEESCYRILKDGMGEGEEFGRSNVVGGPLDCTLI
ncbi:hypothetical protein ACLOJK_002548 [Asimina triloba]